MYVSIYLFIYVCMYMYVTIYVCTLYVCIYLSIYMYTIYYIHVYIVSIDMYIIYSIYMYTWMYIYLPKRIHPLTFSLVDSTSNWMGSAACCSFKCLLFNKRDNYNYIMYMYVNIPHMSAIHVHVYNHWAKLRAIGLMMKWL